LSFGDERDGERRRRSQEEADDDAQAPAQRRKRPPVPEVGHALRSAYQRTLDEDIPPEMIDLLGKLG
jgi:hypothetical protein